jgi:hypothetical protein
MDAEDKTVSDCTQNTWNMTSKPESLSQIKMDVNGEERSRTPIYVIDPMKKGIKDIMDDCPWCLENRHFNRTEIMC